MTKKSRIKISASGSSDYGAVRHEDEEDGLPGRVSTNGIISQDVVILLSKYTNRDISIFFKYSPVTTI